MNSDATDWSSAGWPTILLLMGLGVLIGILKDVVEAWRADRPWFGWDFRQRKRIRRTDEP